MSERNSFSKEFPLNEVPEILCIGVNPAFQTTLRFNTFRAGCVNRAFSKKNSVGGKGQNVAIAVQQLGRAEQVAVLQFTGGETGNYIRGVLAQKGIRQYNVIVEQPTRRCTIALDVKKNCSTDLIEPSSCIESSEYDTFKCLAQHLFRSPKLQAIALCGTVPDGVDASLYSFLVHMKPPGCLLLLDAYSDVDEALMSGNVDILKINHEEAVKLAQIDSSISQLGKSLIRKFKLRYLVITDGPQSAVLFISGGPDTSFSLRTWQFHLPSWTQILPSLTSSEFDLVDANLNSSFISPPVDMPILNCVGAGDTCSGVLLSKYLDTKDIVEAVRYGLSAATASCLTTDSSAHFKKGTMYTISALIQMEFSDEPK